MKVLANIRNAIIELSNKDFYKYLVLFLLGFTFIIALVLFRYYRSIDNLHETIEFTNDLRLRTKKILYEKKEVKKNKRRVDELIKKEESFKISGYFSQVLTTLNLNAKKVTGDTTHIDHENNYRESIFKVKLSDMSMKEVCELISKLDEKDRIYIKSLDLVKSKRNRRSLDVTLTITTLESK
jgi:hypothetical protein